MSARKRKNLINLLPKSEFESSTTGRVLLWLLSTFRYIVIITELVVMVAFLSRFWLDARNSDLDDQIKQKKAQIVASQSFEEEFRNTQQRLQIFSELTSDGTNSLEVLDTLSTNIPPEIFLDTLAIQKDLIRVEGFSLTERAVAQYIVNLEDGEIFEQVNLTDIERSLENDSLIEFSLSINK